MLAFLCKNLDYKPQSINQPNTTKQTCLNRIFFTGLLLYVCVGFVCVQIKLCHSHSHMLSVITHSYMPKDMIETTIVLRAYQE